MEFYVKMTDKELEDFKNSKNNPNLVDLSKLNVTQLLDLKLKKVDSAINVNPMTGMREARSFYEDERKSVEVILIAKEVY